MITAMLYPPLAELARWCFLFCLQGCAFLSSLSASFMPVFSSYHPRKPSVSSPPPAGILPREKMQDHPRESEVRVISASMPVGRREEIVRYLKNLLVSDSQISETQLVAALKRWLEAKYEPTWHVLAIKGSYWMHYSHEVDCSFQFHLGSHVYLMWRTPTG